CLTDALLVLDEGEADVPLAVFAEADARGDGDLRLLDAELGELERAERAVLLGNRGPDEHRPLRLLDGPSDLVESVDEDVAPLPMDVDDIGHHTRVALEGDDPRDLDGLERSVVEVRLDAGEGVDHPRVAAYEAEAPARHVVRLRRGEDLDADLLRARHFQERGRTITVVREVRVREVVDHHEPVLARERDDALEE